MARAGDPEYQFTVGWVLLQWVEDPQPKAPPKIAAKEALGWIYKAAHAGVPQAISTLREGYEWGRFSLPKNVELTTCWRKVERGEQKAGTCFAVEPVPSG
ncbi:hypothetical protein GCM10009105_12780 [Dokdonella soli]|uniref:Uncharacterized protein n=1 Tax=Dokdonella soli TaxID=529810 RepID=A0ABN1IEP2_9GAMM